MVARQKCSCSDVRKGLLCSACCWDAVCTDYAVPSPKGSSSWLGRHLGLRRAETPTEMGVPGPRFSPVCTQNRGPEGRSNEGVCGNRSQRRLQWVSRASAAPPSQPQRRRHDGWLRRHEQHPEPSATLPRGSGPEALGRAGQTHDSVPPPRAAEQTRVVGPTIQTTRGRRDEPVGSFRFPARKRRTVPRIVARGWGCDFQPMGGDPNSVATTNQRSCYRRRPTRSAPRLSCALIRCRREAYGCRPQQADACARKNWRPPVCGR